jgi:hypothetical protein
MPEHEMHALLKAKSKDCGRVVRDSEIAHQIRAARKTAWCPHFPHLFTHAEDTHAEDLSADVHLPPDAPKWQEPNLGEIDRIVSHRLGLTVLRDLSPVKIYDDPSASETIFDAIWPGNALLCCGLNSWTFATRRREVWRSHLSKYAYTVPNPMLRVHGRTKEGKDSEHSLDATAARIYQVTEFDFSEFAKDAKTETIWAPLVRDWKSRGISIEDACASLHLHLSVVRPLVLVTHSGGKSLHGWYACFEETNADNERFMRYAVSIGADPATWTRSQFVRMPGGTRENGKPQIVHYFNPAEVVK